MENNKDHNIYQRSYYESALDKPAMQVRDTPYVRNHIRKMVRHSNITRDHAILEVGAGLGKFSIPLLQQGFNITCNDISPVLLEKLRAGAPVPVDTVCCDISTIDSQEIGLFDKIIGFFTLHHMEDLNSVFRALNAVLKPGGELFFIEPLARNPLYYLQVAFTPKMTWQAEKGIMNMSDRVIHRSLRNAGLTPGKSVTYGFLPPFLYNRRLGKKTDGFLDSYNWMKFAHAFSLFHGTKDDLS
ncbi:class I SAM-dependent methyltransferase [Desulforhopalus singaporensis]|uniref:Methyltransferase domain-containing protein n=1 Tax=Desulforhopalus singaporensis TaxID=91360 RepID=A0A1H0LFT4_9BACT|nr:class I SAM-dependent methyltransferase [Desulforhopalus singaporensis]SDO66916.1 Methyltransferase domain-containing protein [Desulforhopalus singaporensis]